MAFRENAMAKSNETLRILKKNSAGLLEKVILIFSRVWFVRDKIVKIVSKYII